MKYNLKIRKGWSHNTRIGILKAIPQYCGGIGISLTL